jgi:hypothetical protein
VLLKKKRSRVAILADDAASAVKPKADLALDKLGTATDQARTTMTETVIPAVQEAKEKVGPALQEAMARVAPVAEQAKEKVGPALQEAKAKVAPVAEQAIIEGKARGRKAAVKLGVAEEPKKSHKLRNLLILVGLGGAVAYVYTKMTGKQADPAWTSSGDEAPARHIAAVDDAGVAAGPVDGSDTAPTAPLPSEETVESPVPTTPDAPLEKKDLA